MAIINIGSKNCSYPDEGEKNWGGKLKKVIFELISYISTSLNNVVLLDSDQVIAGHKVFENAPKVFIGTEDSNKREVRLVNEEEFLSKINYEELELRLNRLEDSFTSMKNNRVKNIEDVLGVSDKSDMKQSLIDKLELGNSDSSTKGSPLNLFFPSLANINESLEDINMTDALTKLAKICDTIVPIGTIMPFHMLSNFQKVQWVDFDENIHNGEQKMELDNGVYKVLSGGPWALCDGRFILPPNYFGKDSKNKCLVIPDLADTFLAGDTRDGNLGKVMGLNEKMMSISQMPYHKHGIDHYHKMYIYWTGLNSGSLRRGSDFATFINHLSQREVGTEGVNRSPWNYGYADLLYNQKEAILFDTTNAYSSDILGQGSKQYPIDVRPRSLKVKFFMRVW